LAQGLLAQGVQAGDVVGLCLPRSAEMIVASLAVWRCGAAFLPLDPDYPAQRLAYLVEDSGMRVLLKSSLGKGSAQVAQQTAVGTSDNPTTRLITIDLESLNLGDYPDALPQIAFHPEQIAYLIYTSGSTGQPKGVAVSHGPLAMHMQAMAELYAMQPSDVCLHFASFSFDAAIEQWAVPLSCGAQLVISDQALWSVEQTLAAIERHGINRIDLPPAYLTELARHLTHSEQAPTMASCTVGGEALPRDSLTLIQNRLHPKRLLNAYGPTETVITPLVWEAEAGCDSAYAPIGRCVGHRTAYILDADLNPLPIGVAGELYIGGPGLAQGYWQKPTLTAECFIPDPFTNQAGARLYRTGDRVRCRADGVIDYLGRLDQQIKLRGYRIELGEIEAALLAQPGVDEAVIMVGDGGQLLGYLASNCSIDSEALRSALQTRLPDYMLPNQFIVLSQLPKLPSGKLDRKALPSPVQTARTCTAPRNAIESQLAAIWQEVLGLDNIGVEDNFFELG
ncbi:MAG: amino acid adenylation domain-containing protein, partial [Aquabacterium sp.]|uniref:amino acid adenylation domain-containing protein n=1 Tax=Aquabacterium sp. TaxID=1872578 RepID=UPI00271638A0